MKVLIAYERSGVIREAFRALSIEAYSNDLEPTDIPSPYHLQCDARDAIAHKDHQWDLIIMHPMCTALAVSGNSTYAKGKEKHHLRLAAIKDTLEVFELAKKHCNRVAMENPVGVLPIKPTQYIQPWQFGHPESKKTGLWLHNLPELKETENVYALFQALPKNKQQRLHYLPPSKDRAKLRSQTFDGVAAAVALQWGIL